MRQYLRGRERALTIVGGLVLPGFMVAVLLLGPLWGWQAMYAILKVAAFFFVVTAAFWYLADDSERHQDTVEDDSWQADAYIKDPPVYPSTEETNSGVATASGESAAGIGLEGGRRAFDRVRNLPEETTREAEEDPAPQTYVFRGELGGSEGLRARGFPKESVLPGDAKLFREYDGWAIYASASKNAIFVRTTDYHPKPLQLTEEMLSEFLESLRPEGKDHSEAVLDDKPDGKKPEEGR